MMNIGGHIEAKGPLTKNKHTKMFATRGSGGRFPNQFPDRGGPPGREYPGGGSPGPPGGQGLPGPQGPAGLGR